MTYKSEYKVEGNKFDNFADAADYAKELMVGKHYDDYVMIKEWQEEGFWEPSHRVERDRSGKPVVKR